MIKLNALLEKRIKEEVKHLDEKIMIVLEKIERDEHRSEDYEDFDNWFGWRDALIWVLTGCESNPHEGDGYE